MWFPSISLFVSFSVYPLHTNLSRLAVKIQPVSESREFFVYKIHTYKYTPLVNSTHIMITVLLETYFQGLWWYQTSIEINIFVSGNYRISEINSYPIYIGTITSNLNAFIAITHYW